MSNRCIITITREFGAEGHEIGKQLSMRMGIPLYDKDILNKAAKEQGVYPGLLKSADESVVNRFLEPYLNVGMEAVNTNDMLFKAEEKVIHQLAEKQTCIIVGRLADYILRDDPNCLKVFIGAPFEFRVKNISEKHNISIEAAKKLVRKMDAARNDYYSYYSLGRWSQKKEKDLEINRAAFGIEGCVDILETMIKTKIGK